MGSITGKLRWFASGMIIAVILSACVRTVVDDNPNKLKGGFHDKALPRKNYPELKDYSLALYPVGNDGAVILDKNAAVKLRLRNCAAKEVRIDEWYMNTPDNVILYYRPFDLRVRRFVPAEWTKIVPKTGDRALRFELTLMPKNSVLITKGLDFMNSLKLKPGENSKFLMVAELNLRSVKVSSSMFSIEMKPK
ncbi:MAG: hypothetical protein PHH77_04915 [Victivallaceae bacterium]|nr:hypothetical protein [Victivallaceae bacterium]